MEVIRLSGYTEDERSISPCAICCPNADEEQRRQKTELTVADSAIRDIVRYYTREAGVRALERKFQDLPQGGQNRGPAQKRSGKIIVNAKNLDKFLGVRRYSFGMAEKENQVGQVTDWRGQRSAANC